MSSEYPCIYFEKDGKCRKFSDDYRFVSYCVMGPCSEQKLSNADRIRAMTDEEMAKSRVIDYEEYPGAYLAIDCEKVFYSEEEAIAAELEWLQQPAEEDT